MVGEIMTGLSLFKSMLDTAKALKEMTDAAGRSAVVIDLQEKIFAAQGQYSELHAQYSALLQRVSELEKELMAIKTWDAEKQRYQLTDYGGGTYAYALKEPMSRGEPPHSICANCYQKGHKSILHFRRKLIKQEEWQCFGCATIFTLGKPNDPERWPALPMGAGPDGWMR